jgi:hypothetical protein
MKINFIVNEENLDSTTDANIMSFLFKKLKVKVDNKLVNVNKFKCEKASINIFFGCINNVLNDYAKANICVPSQNSFFKEWTKHLDNFDLILVKTRYMEDMFKTYVSAEKIAYVGWRSTDLYSSVDKEFDEFLLYCYNDKFTNYQQIIDSWEAHYPTLNIINGSLFNFKKKQDNLNYLGKLTQNEFENLYNRCGVHLCLSSIESFSHTINQCSLSKSIPLYVNGGPMSEIVNAEDCFPLKGKKKKITNLLGSKYDYAVDDLKAMVEKVIKTSDTTLETMGENNRKNAVRNHGISDDLFKKALSPFMNTVRSNPSSKSNEIVSTELPKVSIVTLTHNRKHLFKLAIYNFNTSDYPSNKVEWVVYDTSNDEEKVADMLPDEKEMRELNIKYIHDNSQITIGEARNRACSEATNNIIVFMDDDDYYFPQSVSKRVNALINNSKNIVGTRYLASLAIHKVISYMNAPGLYSTLGRSISPASLCFYKNILTDSIKFDDENINECETLFNSMDLSLFKELGWEEIIVSISHKNNITNRNVPNSKPNGCHYGWSDKLLKFILELDD